MTIDKHIKEDFAKRARDALDNNKGVRKKVMDFFLCCEYALCRDYDAEGKCKKEKRDCKYAELGNQEVKCEHYHNKNNMFGGNRLAHP